MSEFTLISRSVDETISIGERIAASLRAGDVVALVGELGAGKTYLTKGIARGLGVTDQRAVNSPTFVLVNEYSGRLAVSHIDAYRLNGPEQLAALGFEEMCQAGGVVIVEWADRVRSIMPESSIWIEIAASGPTSRSLNIRAVNPIQIGQLDLA